MKLFMHLEQRSYDIIIKRGSLANVHRFTDLEHRRALVVTDEKTPAVYADSVLAQCRGGQKFICPAGAAGKTTASFVALANAMAEMRFSAADVLVAVGGGAVGDLVGFAAAAWRGGVDYVLCPTTLLAQLSCAAGGRVSLDLGGAGGVSGQGALALTWQPCLVVIDPNVLETLSKRQTAAGLAVALRAALLSDPELFEMLETGEADSQLEQVIYHTLIAQKNMAEQSAARHAEPTALTLGQPMAGVIESLRGLRGRRTTGLLYGECLALGILCAIQDKPLLRRARAVCRRLGLPCRLGSEHQKLRRAIAALPCPEQGMNVVHVTGLGGWRVDRMSCEQLCAQLLPAQKGKGAEQGETNA